MTRHAAIPSAVCRDRATLKIERKLTMGHRLIALVLSLMVIVGVSVSLAQVTAAKPAVRALDPDSVAVRLILGMGDATPQDWSGRIAVDKGEILAIEGLRFREGDMVTGRDSWKASSRSIRKAAAAKKAAAKAKRQAAAKAKRQAAAKAIGQPAPKAAAGPSTTGPAVTPNGVVIALKNVAGATLTVDTKQGKFTIAVDRLADGSSQSLLNDRVSVQRVFPHAPLFEGASQQDFPAAAADSQGGGAWVAAVWHESRGPELMPAVDQQPKNFAEFLPTGGGDQVRLLHFQNGEAGGTASTSQSPAATSGAPPLPLPATAASWSSGPRSVDDKWNLFSRRYEPKTSSFSPDPAHDRSARSRQRRRPRKRGERHRLDGLASVDRRPGGHLAGRPRWQTASPAHRL